VPNFAQNGYECGFNNEVAQQALLNLPANYQITPPQLGGKYAPAKTLNGSFVKILVIFAQFKDDNKDSNDVNWPKNQLPVWANSFIGTNPSQAPFAQGTLSNYFYEMSNGQNIVIGQIHPELVIVDAPVTTNYGIANKKVLEIADSKINFNNFDNWDMMKNYTQIFNKKDNYVDAIYIIWRNLDKEIHKWGGIAQLGSYETQYSNYITLDGSILSNRIPTISMTLNIGKNGNYSYNNNLLGLLAHEYGHYAIDANHDFEPYYGLPGTRQRGIGLMPGWAGTLAMNPYEKYLLGYTTYSDVFYNQTGSLSDFQENGICYRIPIPLKNPDGTNNNNPSEYFLIANHQKKSYYEQTRGKGLYIYHVKNKTYSTNNMDVISADGLWQWKIEKWVQRPNGIGGPVDYINKNAPGTPLTPKLPYIVRDKVDRINGRDELQELIYAPYEINDGKTYWWDKWVDANGNVDESPIGDQEDAFNTGYNQLFSPWSNPSSLSSARKNTFTAVEIVNDNNGSFNLQFYVDSLSSLSTKPSKPQNIKVQASSTYHPLIQWEGNI